MTDETARASAQASAQERSQERSYEPTFGASLLEHEEARRRTRPTIRPWAKSSPRFSRRGFLKGALAVSAIAATVSPLALMTRRQGARPQGAKSAFTFNEVEAGVDDNHHVAEGYDAECCCAGATRSSPTRRPSTRRTQTAEAQAKQFGYNNDYVGYIPMLDGSVRAWPARRQPRIHQPASDVPRHRQDRRDGRQEGDRSRAAPKEQVDIEMAAHGGTIVEIRKDGGKWQLVQDGKLQPPHHRRHRNEARPARPPAMTG